MLEIIFLLCGILSMLNGHVENARIYLLWIRLDLGRRRRRSPPHRPNARFVGSFPSILSVFRITPGSTPTAPIDRPRLRTSRDFTLPSSEGTQHFTLLAL